MDENNKQSLGIKIPQRQTTDLEKRRAQAVVDYRRKKVEDIYSGNSNYKTPHTTPLQNNFNQPKTIVDTKTYEAIVDPIHNKQNIKNSDITTTSKIKVANNNRASDNSASIENGQWKKYHEAWQSYYQKYYESYYSAAFKHQQKMANIQPEVMDDLSDQQAKMKALAKIRKDIMAKAQEKTEKIRSSRHFVPITSVIVVVFTFVFLQYNRLIFASVEAYVAPGNSTAQHTVYSPNASINVGNDPKLIIPKLNVDVPVIYGAGNDSKSQLKAMEKGVAHFAIPGANSVPGQAGNTVLSGHSSNDLFDNGEYKFIFAQLEKMQNGDTIYSNYKGKRYTYIVRRKEVVMPNEVSKVVMDTDKPWLTLITCTPIGTAEKRLLVFAEQVAPDPSTADVKKPENNAEQKNIELPRNSKTFLERLFSWDW